MSVSIKTVATVFARHWVQDGGAWRCADNAAPELRKFLAALPARYSESDVHAALMSLSTGRPMPEMAADAIGRWAGTSHGLDYCRQVFASKRPTAPTSFDDVLARARRAFEADLISHVHAFLARQLNR